MYNAFKSIGRLKFFALLIIFQLAFGLSMLSSVFMIQENVTSKEDAFTTMFDTKNTYLVKVNSSKSTEESCKLSDALADEMYELKDKGIVKNIFSYAHTGSVLDELYEHANDEYKKIISRGNEDSSNYICTINIDENFYDRYKFKVDEGRNFEEEDFSKDYKTQNIPILLGSDYKGKVAIGEVFTEEDVAMEMIVGEGYREDDINYEVIGFVKENTAFSFFNSTKLLESVKFSNSLVFAPNITDCFWYGKGIVVNDTGVFMELNSEYTLEEVESEINKIIKEVDPSDIAGFKLETLNLQEDMGTIKEFFKNDTRTTLIMGLALIILSIIGIVTTILGQIDERRKEFGIRIASGATIQTLCLELLFEIGMLICIAVILSDVYLYFTNENFFMNLKVFIGNALFISVITVIISIIPIFNLRNVKPADLMRGEKK